MVIKYTLAYNNPYRAEKPIEMCGIFRDLEHFSKFKKLETDRGRIVGNDWEILAQRESDVNA